MSKNKTNTYLLVWKTSTDKYNVTEGETIAAAFTNAGYGGGALGALDFYADITTLVRSPKKVQTLREVAAWKGTYFWKRETCEKLCRLGVHEILAEVPANGNDGHGWKIGPAWPKIDEYLKNKGL